jgi:hypothetical protein
MRGAIPPLLLCVFLGGRYLSPGSFCVCHNQSVMDEKLRNVYSLPNAIIVIKSRRLKWMGHASRMEDVMQ